jgi:predicted secreted hydrolase
MQNGGAADGFSRAREVKTFDFPRDHGPHSDFRHEWWYVTGNLHADNGERFGFELTFFRFALAPPRTMDARPSAGEISRWRANQIYMAHFAITDVARKRFRFADRYARAALGLAGAQAAPLRVWLQDWSLSETGSQWKLQAAQDDYVLTLDLRPLVAPVLNGDAGLSRKSSTSQAASYYYSIPRMAARGQLTREGKTVGVSGLAWLDREWGSDELGIETGWDWFALQLGDESTLMFYVRRDREGKPDSISAGTWVATDGTVRRLTEKEVEIDVQGHWTSPRGGRYPARWQMRVPSLSLDLNIEPVLADQELNTSPRYWEGAVDVIGTRAGRAVRGRGYVELVGYAAPSS